MSDSWKTGVSGDWGQAGNWTAGVPSLPENSDTVTISAAGDYIVTVTAAENFTVSGLTVDNATTTLDVAGILNIYGSSTFAGIVDLTGQIFALDSSTLAGGFFDLSGKVLGDTLFELDGGTLALDGGAIGLPTVSLAGADIVLHSDLNYSGSFLESSGTLNLNGFNATLSGISDLGTGGDTIGNDGITTFAMISGPGTLDITNFAEVDSISLSNGAVLQDNGIIVDAGYLYFGGYNDGFYGNPTDSASMSISSGAIFDFIASSMPDEYNQFPITYFTGPTSSIVNAGLFEMLASGNNPILPFFKNLSSGTIYVAAGADVQFTGGGVFAGQIKGAGEIDLTGGTYALAAGLAINAASFAIAGEDFQIPVLLLDGSSTLAGSGELGEGSDNSGLYGADATITGQGTLDITGKAYVDSLNLTGGAVLKDSGTIILNGNLDLGDDSLLSNDSGTNAALLSIAAGGVFEIITGGGINDYDSTGSGPGAASIINAGLFEVSSPGTDQIVPFFTNLKTGTVNAAAGADLQFSGGGSLAGHLGGAGEIDLAGGTYTLEPGLVINATSFAIAGENSETPVLLLNGHVTLAGSGQLGEGSGYTSDNATITGPGALDITGTADVAGLDLTRGAELQDSGTIILNRNLDLGSAALLSIAARGVFDIAGTGFIKSSSAADSIVNAGLLELTSKSTTATSKSVVEGQFTNTGTVAVFTSKLLFNDVKNGQSGTLSGGVWEVISSVQSGGSAAALALSTAVAINTDDARITLSGSASALTSGTGGGTSIEKSLSSIASGGLLSLLEARGYKAGVNLSDAGVILVQGGTFSAPAIEVAAGGRFDLYGAVLATPTLGVATGGILGGYGTITGVVDNNGLIEVTDSALTVAGDLSGNGSLRIDQDSELVLEAAVSRGTDITFGDSHAVLALDEPGSFSGTLVSFQPSDTIELIGISSIVSEHLSNDVLTLSGQRGSITLTFANSTDFGGGLVVKSAGGNTSITELPTSTGTGVASTGGERAVEEMAGNGTIIPEIGAIDLTGEAAMHKLKFLCPAMSEVGNAETKSIRQSIALDSISGRQLPIGLFLTERHSGSADKLRQAAAGESSTNFTVGHSELITSMGHVYALLLQSMKSG